MQQRSNARSTLLAAFAAAGLLAANAALAQASLSGPPPGKPGATSASVSPGASSAVSVSPGASSAVSVSPGAATPVPAVSASTATTRRTRTNNLVPKGGAAPEAAKTAK